MKEDGILDKNLPLGNTLIIYLEVANQSSNQFLLIEIQLGVSCQYKCGKRKKKEKKKEKRNSILVSRLTYDSPVIELYTKKK